MRELALFAGAGGGILGGQLLGWKTVCAVEIDPFCREVLLRRQLDGCLPRFPIWDDVCTFDGRPWRGAVDVVSGGFPCQDISPAGTRRGITGKHSKLWFEMSRIIRAVRPSFVFAENNPHLRTKGLGTVVNEITGMGYECRWGVLGARHVGAPHKQRNRIWITASNIDRFGLRVKPGWECGEDWEEKAESALSIWWATEPDVVRVVYGLPFRVDRIRALGNAQIPAVAALAWEVLR